MMEPRRAVHGGTRMPETSAAARIAADLRAMLTRGLVLSAATLHFIDSTFAHPSAAELGALIADDNVPERDSLLELLFSPDEALQIALEERLDLRQGALPRVDEVIAHLAAAPLAVEFRFPDGRGHFEVAMTAPLARRLVCGLGIDRELPERVAEAIAARGAGAGATRLRVMIRNARFAFTPAASEFLCALVATLDPDDEEDRSCLAFAMEILAETGASADVFAALAARKQWLSRALQHGRRLREQLARSNLETLLSQGQRLTWVDEALARRQMDHVDRIGRAVFGRGLPAGADGERQPVEIDGLPDVAELMRRLS
jgi:hypothetical protein